MATFQNGHYISLHRFDCQHPNIKSTSTLLLVKLGMENRTEKKKTVQGDQLGQGQTTTFSRVEPNLVG